MFSERDVVDSVDIQKRVRRWVESRLGVSAMDPHERAMRMLEEATELAQALGVSFAEFRAVGLHVYDKPPGEPMQEFGGAALTLLACADGCGYILSECADTELRRIENLPPDKFRKRQNENAENGIGARVKS